MERKERVPELRCGRRRINTAMGSWFIHLIRRHLLMSLIKDTDSQNLWQAHIPRHEGAPRWEMVRGGYPF